MVQHGQSNGRGIPRPFKKSNIFRIQLQPIFQPHGNQPWGAVAPVEEYGCSVLEPCGVPHRLGHCLGNIQPFHPLDLRMDAGNSNHVRAAW